MANLRCRWLVSEVGNRWNKLVSEYDFPRYVARVRCCVSFQVRMAAFQALGGFISTFANPELTGLSLTDDGRVVAHELSEKQL